MAAPSVAMMMGAETSAAHVALEEKSTGAGKTFAESLDERIAAEADAAEKISTEVNAPQIQPAVQPVMSAVGQDSRHGSVVMANTSWPPCDGTPAASMPVVKAAVVSQAQAGQAALTIAEAKVAGAGDNASEVIAATASETQEAQAVNATAEQVSEAVAPDLSDADVKTLDDTAIVTADMRSVGNKQAQSEKTQPSGEISQLAQVGASTAAPDEANAQIISQPPEKTVPTSSEKSATTGSGASEESSMRTTKKHATAKVESSTKTASTGTNTSIVSGTTVVVAGGAAVANPVVTGGATASVSQTAMQPVSKQGVVAAAVVTGTPMAALSAGSHQSKVQQNVPVKPVGDGTGVSGQDVPNPHVAQKDAQMPAKPVDSTVVASSSSAIAQTVNPSEKLQTANVTASVLHSAGAAGPTANSSGTTAAVQVAMAAAQKITLGGVSTPLPSSHIGGGDLSGAAGAQTAMLNDSHKTLVSTPTVLEVGIPNGTQGWLKVRAELTGGGVNASLSAASSAGQEMLHRELPALTTYLQQEKVAVNSLVVQAPAAGAFRGLTGGTGGYSGGQTQRQGQGNSGRDNLLPAARTAPAEMNLQAADELPAAMQYPSGGGWLSVRA